MAALTNADYKEIRTILYRSGQGKEELKALANLPNETQLKASFQALEDRWDAVRASFKTNADAGLGVTTTASLIRSLFEAWLANRRRRGL